MVRLTWIIAFLFAQTAYSQVDLRGNTSIETHRIQSDTVNNSPNKQFEKRIKLFFSNNPIKDFNPSDKVATGRTTNQQHL